MSVTFDRPNLTDDEKAKAIKFANQLVNTQGRQATVAVILMLAIENMKLLKEVNIHRQTLGYEPLPVREVPQ